MLRVSEEREGPKLGGGRRARKVIKEKGPHYGNNGVRNLGVWGKRDETQKKKTEEREG